MKQSAKEFPADTINAALDVCRRTMKPADLAFLPNRACLRCEIANRINSRIAQFRETRPAAEREALAEWFAETAVAQRRQEARRPGMVPAMAGGR